MVSIFSLNFHFLYTVPISSILARYVLKKVVFDYLQRKGLVFQKRYELRYAACLEALRVVDAYFSHFDWEGKLKLKVVRQYATTEEVRDCYNKLLLSCLNPETVKTFLDIMLGKKEDKQDGEKDNLFKKYNDFRNMIREELGFEGKMYFDEERTYIGCVISDNSQK